VDTATHMPALFHSGVLRRVVSPAASATACIHFDRRFALCGSLRATYLPACLPLTPIGTTGAVAGPQRAHVRMLASHGGGRWGGQSACRPQAGRQAGAHGEPGRGRWCPACRARPPGIWFSVAAPPLCVPPRANCMGYGPTDATSGAQYCISSSSRRYVL